MKVKLLNQAHMELDYSDYDYFDCNLENPFRIFLLRTVPTTFNVAEENYMVLRRFNSYTVNNLFKTGLAGL